MSAPYEGGCLCAAIRYRVNDEPITLYACHCTDCQRQTGAGFALSMIVPRRGLELLRGAPRHYAVDTPEGLRKCGAFCGDCGSRLWGEPPKFPQLAVVRPGNLDDTKWFRPVGHIWTASAQPWIPIPEDTLRFPGQPEDMTALIHAWRDREAQ